MSDFSKLTEPLNENEQAITAVLCQLSAAVSTGRPLPPGIKTPQPYQISKNLRKLDPQILHSNHVEDLGYSVFAVMEIVSGMISYKLDELVATVEQLVGVTDFEVM